VAAGTGGNNFTKSVTWMSETRLTLSTMNRFAVYHHRHHQRDEVFDVALIT